jgi:hypothetical protein
MCVQLREMTRPECKNGRDVRYFVSALVYLVLGGITTLTYCAALNSEEMYCCWLLLIVHDDPKLRLQEQPHHNQYLQVFQGLQTN